LLDYWLFKTSVSAVSHLPEVGDPRKLLQFTGAHTGTPDKAIHANLICFLIKYYTVSLASLLLSWLTRLEEIVFKSPYLFVQECFKGFWKEHKAVHKKNGGTSGVVCM